MVYELGRVGALSDLLSDKQGCEIAARPFMKQMCEAVETVHKLGFVHLDIKPLNFVIKEDRKGIRLIDFGICKKWKATDKPLTTRAGTPCYKPPEQSDDAKRRLGFDG